MNPHYDRGENLVEDAENVVSHCLIGRNCSLVLTMWGVKLERRCDTGSDYNLCPMQ